MTTPSSSQVAPLLPDQIARFKRDGYLVLPGVLNPDRCAEIRDDMWRTLAVHLPRMRRDDPRTWTPITEEEHRQLSVRRPSIGGDPYCSGKGHRFFLRNGTEERMLDVAPRALWSIAEQLLGVGTVVWPGGHDEEGYTCGPCFMSDDAVGSFSSHLGPTAVDYPQRATFTTDPALRLPKTGPVWLTGQGSRGIYCTLPDSPDPGPDFTGAHSDGACYGRYGLQFAAYLDDLPPASGGFTVWPGSHIPIWREQWAAFKDGEKHTDKHLENRRAGGYTDPAILRAKAEIEPVDTHGPAGTVVLWHTKILHMAGQNKSNDIIRQATIYGYMKTPEAVPDALAADNTDGDIWRDWSEEVRATDA